MSTNCKIGGKKTFLIASLLSWKSRYCSASHLDIFTHSQLIYCFCWGTSAKVLNYYKFDSISVTFAGWENNICCVLLGGAGKNENTENLRSIWCKLLPCSRGHNQTEANNSRSMQLVGSIFPLNALKKTWSMRFSNDVYTALLQLIIPFVSLWKEEM